MDRTQQDIELNVVTGIQEDGDATEVEHGDATVEETVSNSSQVLDHQHHAANFAIDWKTLVEIVEANNVKSLLQYGGIEGIARALETNIKAGICGNDENLFHRQGAFGSNLAVGEPPDATKTLCQLTFESLKDATTILLSCCGLLSLILGIFKYGVEDGYRDGAVIFVTVFITVLFKLYKERKQSKRPRSKNIATVDVMRDGLLQNLCVSRVVVGDILHLKPGDIVPADGLFINGNPSLKLDDDELLVVDRQEFPSIFAGAKVVEGECHVLVMSVGENTRWSKMMSSVSSSGNGNNHKAQLQIKVDELSSKMEKIALGLFLVLLVVQLLYYFIKNTTNGDRDGNGNHPDPKDMNRMEDLTDDVTRIIKKQGRLVTRLIAAMGVLVMGIREGLHLGVLISFLYSKKMMFDEAVVTELPACATIGLVTTICTRKTVDLAFKQTKMAELWIGQNATKEVPTGIARDVLNVLREGVSLNTSGPTEDAQICWARLALGVDVGKLQQSCTVIQNEAFDINKCCSRALLKRNGQNAKLILHAHWKGAPSVVLPMCSDYYDVDGTIKSLDEQQRIAFEQISVSISADSLHCMAFAYKRVVLDEHEEEEESEESCKLIEHGLTLIGLVGFKNPYSQELQTTVKACRDAGVSIKLVLPDDKNMARFIAINSGILRPDEDKDGAVVDAAEFQNLYAKSSEIRVDDTRLRANSSPFEGPEIRVDNIRVMAKSSPFEELLMVQCLRQKGEVVAVTGNSTTDSPLLNEADVGLWIGGGYAETENKSTDIVISSKCFISIAAILCRGRYVYNNIQKIIQLHLTVNMAGLAINFVAAIPSGETPLSPIQLLWVSLIMDTLGAFALATDPPGRCSSERPPVTGASWLTTKAMRRNITTQVLYQTVIFLILHFKGNAIVHGDRTAVNAVIFNCYVLCQVFVLLNGREMERTNIFRRIHQNRWFLGMVGGTVGLQVVIMEIAGVLNRGARLDLEMWCVCIGLAAPSLLIGLLAKRIRVFNES